MLSLIVAMSTNRTIGINNSLPWHLPNDLKYFKQATMGKPIVMGRKTFESIGKPLPGRRNIVITRDANYQADGIDVVSSLEQAISLGEDICLVDGQEEVMVIGGAQIYELALPKADRLYITHVDAEVNGDAFFPEVDWPSFTVMAEESFAAEGPNPYDYRFSVYQRTSAE
ncbi:type 3 dihydrofolate reductase [Marinomonas posidonica]|uniref:Dihydrofolate reductase n=1 Tax=Marinomonas posidonica (strain CECT 7376 / NCIMB 14433 / IVIA-Po-181) TaxID=491952 RepID=F6D0G2_MARPP|nr:type 3 dihydrofolate reductase [Marinomonas posidonica]AEF53684.1 Dihydrofolate reductase [Marinomonas posidonica IVIA-Po-181]